MPTLSSAERAKREGASMQKIAQHVIAEQQRLSECVAAERMNAITHASHANALREALEKVLSEPSDCAYPERDVYGLNGTPEDNGDDDAAAPLWTEAGLYGRVGKDAARTILARMDHAREVLASTPTASLAAYRKSVLEKAAETCLCFSDVYSASAAIRALAAQAATHSDADAASEV